MRRSSRLEALVILVSKSTVRPGIKGGPVTVWRQRQSILCQKIDSDRFSYCELGHRNLAAGSVYVPLPANMNKEVVVLTRTFIRLTTAAIVVAAVLMLALPFFLALSWPFFGR